MSARDYDIVAAEVHRKALENLTNEMAITLVRTSGSPVVTEAKDFSTCILDTVPEHLGFAAYVLFHAGTSLVATERIAQLHAETVRPGDGWIVNDPHEGGAAHQGDVAIVMPVFYGEELLGWTFANMHVLDTGGSGVSAYAPGAHDVYEEGLLFPPLRIIRAGEIDAVWEDFITANVRMPGPVLNDIRSMISANNVGARKFLEIVEDFGLDRHKQYCSINKDLSEEVLRRRIERIPDGVYEVADWNEFDGHDGPERLLELRLRLEVRGSDLHFSYSGVPQIDAFVNSARGAMLGQTLTTLLTTLAYGDLPVNGGLWRPIHLDLGPPGTIVNSVHPAAVSNAHSEVGMRAAKMTKDVLSQALALSGDPELRGRLGGQAQDGWPGMGVYGLNQRRRPTVVFVNNASVGIGGGAQTIGDGQDCYGCTCMTGCGLPDVETWEAIDPLLFLWRRLIPNSGGPGQYRGGQGMEEAMAIRGSERLDGPAFNAVAQVPPRGFGGGYPAAASRLVPVRETNIGELLERGVFPNVERFSGTPDHIRSKVARMTLRENDIVLYGGGGGGGVGDPLLRSTHLVLADVADGYVTAEHAEAVYGVALAADGRLDEDRTAERRERIRAERIGRAPDRPLRAPASVGVAVAVRSLDGRSFWVCASCEHRIAPAGDDWRRHVARRESAIGEAYDRLGMYVRRRTEPPGVAVVEHFCPRCAAALFVDVTLDDVEPPHAPRLAAVAAKPTAGAPEEVVAEPRP